MYESAKSSDNIINKELESGLWGAMKSETPQKLTIVIVCKIQRLSLLL